MPAPDLARDPVGQSGDQLSFGRRLRLLRVRARMAQEVLPERARVSVATIEALEADRRRKPYLHTVAALSDALGLEADERTALEAAASSHGEALDLATSSARIFWSRPTVPNCQDVCGELDRKVQQYYTDSAGDTVW